MNKHIEIPAILTLYWYLHIHLNNTQTFEIFCSNSSQNQVAFPSQTSSMALSKWKEQKRVAPLKQTVQSVKGLLNHQTNIPSLMEYTARGCILCPKFRNYFYHVSINGEISLSVRSAKKGRLAMYAVATGFTRLVTRFPTGSSGRAC